MWKMERVEESLKKDDGLNNSLAEHAGCSRQFDTRENYQTKTCPHMVK